MFFQICASNHVVAIRTFNKSSIFTLGTKVIFNRLLISSNDSSPVTSHLPIHAFNGQSIHTMRYMRIDTIENFWVVFYTTGRAYILSLYRPFSNTVDKTDEGKANYTVF